MHPIDTLTLEHRVILDVLEPLREYGKRIGWRGDADPADLPKFVMFLREYADRRHHGKEEDFLFRAMEADGFPWEEGPIAVMLSEHDEGRALLNHLNALAGCTWTDSHRTQVRLTTGSLATMLTEHIAKEDEILYQIAHETLSVEVFAEMETQFTLLDAKFDVDILRATRPLVRRYAP